MIGTSRSLDGKTAIVTGGGSVVGRAVALALAARGVNIVVTGRDEKALGETVGEVVHGGGKARHVAGDLGDASHLSNVLARATEVFGAPSIVVAADDASVEQSLKFFGSRLVEPGSLLAVVAVDAHDDDRVLSMSRALARDVAAKRTTCNAIAIDRTAVDDGAEDAAELAVFLCSRTGARITGQVIAVGHEVRTRTRA
ncbi:MAG: gluconate 5-dehydrogenase [Labilithrix sp.]|nr:gluconate 5-dehydrogenase [Labilithrix sp.]